MKPMQLIKIKKGYVVLLSTIILSVVGSILILSLYQNQIGGSQITLININKNQASALSLACSEQALYEISMNTSTTTNNSRIDFDNNHCLFSIKNESIYKRIESEGDVNNIVKKESILINQNNRNSFGKMEILSWQEI